MRKKSAQEEARRIRRIQIADAAKLTEGESKVNIATDDNGAGDNMQLNDDELKSGAEQYRDGEDRSGAEQYRDDEDRSRDEQQKDDNDDIDETLSPNDSCE